MADRPTWGRSKRAEGIFNTGLGGGCLHRSGTPAGIAHPEDSECTTPHRPLSPSAGASPEARLPSRPEEEEASLEGVRVHTGAGKRGPRCL